MKRALFLAGASVAGLTIASAATPHASASSDEREAARIELGRRLFMDPVIGRAGRVSCAACHDPEHGFSDARVKSVDETGPLPRHSQPVTDMAGVGFHWDGEFVSVREIVEARVLPRDVVAASGVVRMLDRVETAVVEGAEWNKDVLRERSSSLTTAYYGDSARSVAASGDESQVELRLAASGVYAPAFRAAFGDPAPTEDRVVTAVDAYVRSLRTTTSPFDRFLAGDSAALSPAARRGHELFVGKAGCAACHVATATDGRAPLTDRAFHDTGVAWDAAAGRLVDRGAGAATTRPGDDGKFKTPSLRDVARRAPYMHDGRFATFEDVVRYYVRGGTPHTGLDERIRPLALSDADVADLVAFLGSLSGDERAGLGGAPPGRAKRLRVRIDFVGCAPRAGVELTVRPAGDRLHGAAEMPKPFVVRTDNNGVTEFPWPDSTHVELTGADVVAPAPPWVPDCAEFVEIPAMDRTRPAFAVPPGILDGIDEVRATQKRSDGPRRAFALRSAHRTANGRALYVGDAPIDAVDGDFELSNSDGRLIGVYAPSKWLVEDDVILRPLPRAQPRARAKLTEGTTARIETLLRGSALDAGR